MNYYNAIEILEHNLIERAQQIAVYSEEGTITFQEVAHTVNRFGNALKKRSVSFNERIGIFATDCTEWAIAFFGAIKIGAVPTLINILQTPQEVAFIIRDAHLKIIVIHQALIEEFNQILSILEKDSWKLEHVIVIKSTESSTFYTSFEEIIRNESSMLEACNTHGMDNGALFYSSGTTGNSKGFFHSHHDLAFIARGHTQSISKLKAGDRQFSPLHLFFFGGLHANLLEPWGNGLPCFLITEKDIKSTTVLIMIQTYKITHFMNVPNGYLALMQNNLLRDYDLSSLQQCRSGGETVSPSLQKRWLELTGIPITVVYGSSELGFLTVNHPPHNRMGSIGKKAGNETIKVMNEQGVECAPQETGVLWAKSQIAPYYYLHQEEKSKHTFIGEWGVTGDTGSVDEEGYYWLIGRSDDLVKIKGIWVSPLEVEEVFLEHPLVYECAVIGVPDENELNQLHAYIVLNNPTQEGKALEEVNVLLFKHYDTRGAHYKRPQTITFLTALPRTATGKIQRYKLRNTHR